MVWRSRCAPPGASVMISSQIAELEKVGRGQLQLRSAASATFAWSFHRIDAQPSGEITE